MQPENAAALLFQAEVSRGIRHNIMRRLCPRDKLRSCLRFLFNFVTAAAERAGNLPNGAFGLKINVPYFQHFNPPMVQK